MSFIDLHTGFFVNFHYFIVPVNSLDGGYDSTNVARAPKPVLLILMKNDDFLSCIGRNKWNPEVQVPCLDLFPLLHILNILFCFLLLQRARPGRRFQQRRSIWNFSGKLTICRQYPHHNPTRLLLGNGSCQVNFKRLMLILGHFSSS